MFKSVIFVATLIAGGIILGKEFLPSVTRRAFVISRLIPISAISGINIAGVGSAIVTEGAVNEVVIEAEHRVIDKLYARVVDSELIIGQKSNTSIITRFPITYRITLQSNVLESIKASGQVSVEIPALKGQRIFAKLDGSSSLTAQKIDAQCMSVEVDGISKLVLAQGAVDEGFINSGGVITFDARNVIARVYHIKADGQVKLDIHATEKISGSMSGVSTVTNHGPGIAQDLKSSGLAMYRRR